LRWRASYRLENAEAIGLELFAGSKRWNTILVRGQALSTGR
jgi:hypothetical protein